MIRSPPPPHAQLMPVKAARYLSHAATREEVQAFDSLRNAVSADGYLVTAHALMCCEIYKLRHEREFPT